MKKKYISCLILELIIIIIIILTFIIFKIDTVNVFDGSLLAILLTLPVTFLNWKAGQSDKFYDKKLAILAEISEKLNCSGDDQNKINDSTIYFYLLQINDIVRMASEKDKKRLNDPVQRLISNLVLHNLDDNHWFKQIKARIGYNTDSSEHFTDLSCIGNYLTNDNMNGITKSLYINYETDDLLSEIRKDGGNNYYLRSHVLINFDNVNITDEDDEDDDKEIIKSELKEVLERVKYSEIEFIGNIKDNEKDELERYYGKDNAGNMFLFPKSESEQNTKPNENTEVEAIVSVSEEYNDGKNYKNKIKLQTNNQVHVKYSRNFSEKENVWAGWFSLRTNDADELLKNKNHFYFLITPSSSQGKSQNKGVRISFTREQFKSYLNTKNGDSYAIVKNQEGNTIYQLYLTYEETEGGNSSLFDTRYSQRNGVPFRKIFIFKKE